MDVVVIGGGIGGLAAAIGLAARGAQVTILEKNAQIGGKLNIWTQDGFTFDTGPHVLTMPWAIDAVFAQAGRRLDEFVTLQKLESICRYHFPDGEKLEAWADAEKTAREIARFAPGDADGFRRFLAYARRVSDATTEPFLKQDFAASIRGVPTLTQWRQLRDFLALKPWKTLREVVHAHFTNPRLRQIFELYALYSGSHPARSSGIFATVADVQWREGTFYVPGGLYALAEALGRLAAECGVKIRLNTTACDVLVTNKRARGVGLASGERVFADVVVCNADCLSALTTLVSPRFRRRWTDARIQKIEPSTSAFLLLLGVRGDYQTELAHHNAFLSADPDGEFDAIFDARRPSADPTVGVACQTVSDPSRAPDGCSNLFVMTNPPPLSDAFDWRVESQNYRELVLTKLENMGLKNLRERILVEQMWTPDDLLTRYFSHRGAIYGLSSNGARQAFLRPPQISPDIHGLYFVGGSTHPGGGLPLCALSGVNLARRLAQTQ